MYQHQHAPLPVEQLNGIPQPLIVLLEVLLAKSPVRRFQTPAELLKVMPTVRDAINAGRALMKTIRVFVSSTGDVQKERHVADRVMRLIAAEFNLPVSASYSIFQRLAEEDDGPENGAPKPEPDNHSPLVLCPYFLEYQRLQLEAGYEGAIPNTAEFDLVICILWSRLGTLLVPTLRMPDGSAPGSGTEYEIGWAVDHAGKNRGLPQLRVYRNCSKPTPPLEPKRSAKPLAGNGTPSRSSLRIGRRIARETSSGRSTTIATCRNLKAISGTFPRFLGAQRGADRQPRVPANAGPPGFELEALAEPRGKQRDDLLGPGLPLAEGEKLVKDFGPSLSREQTDYVSASVNERNGVNRLRNRNRYAVMAAISVLALVAGFQWLQAEHQRQTAERNEARI